MSDEFGEEMYLKAVCSDSQCKSVIYLTSHTPSVECFRCGQRHDRLSLQNIQVVTGEELKEVVAYILISSSVPKRGPDMVKVLGLSNYYCKLLSPFLTTYGMDRSTRQPKLLLDMGRGEIFDCSSLSSRAFLIDPKFIDVHGFGRDVTGSMSYLSDTLRRIRAANGGEERLLPIYADGDGHCLVHAVSRALVGRELFWHPLRSCLKRFLQRNIDKFKELFQNFIDTDEWPTIIEECDPEFKPPEGDFHGLRNIHIFGLANILRRPIILLDSWECMNKSGDYSGLFLPGFIPPDQCRGDDNALNKPLCIAWSNKSHNHYIPLVGILNAPLPVLPRSLIPSVFRMPQTDISSYMEFDAEDNCVIGGNRVLSDSYLHCLVFAMETQFSKVHNVHPLLVADAKHYFYSNNVFLNTSTAAIIQQVRSLVGSGCLFRCLRCGALNEMHLDPSWFQFGGAFYTSLLEDHKKFIHGAPYMVQVKHDMRITVKYDSKTDSFIPDTHSFNMEKCTFCHSTDLNRIESNVKQDLETKSDDKKIPDSQNKVKQEPYPDIVPLPKLKVERNDTAVEDANPDFQLVQEEQLAEEMDKRAAAFIQENFKGETAGNMLKSYTSCEILKKIGRAIAEKSNGESNMDTDKNQYLDSKTNATNRSYCEPSTSKMYTIKMVFNGREATVDINQSGLSYLQLQNIIKDEFSIPFSNQRIKTGFPLKVLEPPHGNLDLNLPLKQGDRLTIENNPVQEVKRSASTPYNRPIAPVSRQPESHSDMWKAAKSQPQLFKRGFQYFTEADQKHIMVDLNHLQIPSFPNKWFSYNYKNECLELCLKPHGHFEIGPDLDSRVEQFTHGQEVWGYRQCPQMLFRTQHSVQQPNKSQERNVQVESNRTSEEVGRVIRRGPGYSVLTRPSETADMDLS